MKRYLERGVELSPEYYEALHFLGEYYYNINRPVDAYKYLKKAEKVYTNQPKFTRDEFYKKLVTIGKTYSIFGKRIFKELSPYFSSDLVKQSVFVNFESCQDLRKKYRLYPIIDSR